MRTVVGVFPSRTEAEQVSRDLNAIGISVDEVTVADSTSAEDHEWSRRNLAAVGGSSFGWFIAGLIPMVAKRGRAAATGLGAAFGAGAGLVAGAIAMAIRGGDPAIIVGSTVVVGAFAGGMIARVYNMGVSHEGIPLTDEANREHGVVVAAHVDESHGPDAVRVMNDHGARNTRLEDDAWLASGWTGAHPVEKPYPSDSSVRSHVPGR